MVRTCASLTDFGLELQGLENLSPREECVCGLGPGFGDHFAIFVLIHCLELKSMWKLGGWWGRVCFPLQALCLHVRLSPRAGGTTMQTQACLPGGAKRRAEGSRPRHSYQRMQRSCDQPSYGVGAWKVSALEHFKGPLFLGEIGNLV